MIVLNKKELIERVSEVSKRTQKDTRRMLDAFLSIVCETLKMGENVEIEYFGEFSCKTLSERKITSLLGDEIILPSQRTPVFKYSRDMQLIIKYNLE